MDWGRIWKDGGAEDDGCGGGCTSLPKFTLFWSPSSAMVMDELEKRVWDEDGQRFGRRGGNCQDSQRWWWCGLKREWGRKKERRRRWEKERKSCSWKSKYTPYVSGNYEIVPDVVFVSEKVCLVIISDIDNMIGRNTLCHHRCILLYIRHLLYSVALHT